VDSKPPSPSPAPAETRRLYARKALRGRATVSLADNVVREATMWDLGADGLCLLVAKPMSSLHCTVSFDVPLATGAVSLTLAAKVVHCSFLGSPGFKVGMRFVNLDAATAQLLAQFAR
jgi:hypothetical protein